MRSLLCVTLDGLGEVHDGVWVVVLVFEHVPAGAGADVVVVVVVREIRGICVAEGGAGAVWEDEGEVAEGLGERGVEEGVVLGICGYGRGGEGREMDGCMGGGGGGCGGDAVGW